MMRATRRLTALKSFPRGMFRFLWPGEWIEPMVGRLKALDVT